MWERASCKHDQRKCVVFSQASMTGSALSLYLEETKVNEDSMFPSEISPVKEDDVPESRIQNSLNLSAGDNPAQGRREPRGLLPTPLALHKVLLFGESCPKSKKTAVLFFFAHTVITQMTLSCRKDFKFNFKEATFQIKSNIKLCPPGAS